VELLFLFLCLEAFSFLRQFYWPLNLALWLRPMAAASMGWGLALPLRLHSVEDFGPYSLASVRLPPPQA
jgi:hypothetical protein